MIEKPCMTGASFDCEAGPTTSSASFFFFFSFGNDEFNGPTCQVGFPDFAHNEFTKPASSIYG